MVACEVVLGGPAYLRGIDHCGPPRLAQRVGKRLLRLYRLWLGDLLVEVRGDLCPVQPPPPHTLDVLLDVHAVVLLADWDALALLGVHLEGRDVGGLLGRANLPGLPLLPSLSALPRRVAVVLGQDRLALEVALPEELVRPLRLALAEISLLVVGVAPGIVIVRQLPLRLPGEPLHVDSVPLTRGGLGAKLVGCVGKVRILPAVLSSHLSPKPKPIARPRSG